MHIKACLTCSFLLTMLMVSPAVVPTVVAAQTSQASAPLVIIRFNQPRVYFDQQLYSAIEKSVAIKPDVMFDVVSYAPKTGSSDADQKWQGVAGHNTQAVIAVMKDMGVPMSRINVTGLSQPGLKYDETRIYVK